jgi:cytochrome c biogenesis protein ResB
MGSVTHWPYSLWHSLGSRRLAVILLVTTLLALVLASLFPPMPTDPTSREMWLAAATLRYGRVTGFLHTLGMFDVYHSFWFLALLAGLSLNTLLCTVQRLSRLWRSLVAPPAIVQPEAFYQRGTYRAEWTAVSLQEGLATARDTLLQHHYHPHIERDQVNNCTSIYVERGRWSQASTLISHLAAVLLVLAVAARPVWGGQESQDPTFPITIGAASLLLAAIVISLWVPHWRLWLRADDEGRMQMVGRGAWVDEFDKIAAEITRACCPQEKTDG